MPVQYVGKKIPAPTVKLGPAVVLYIEPHRGEGHEFAQCKLCRMFLAKHHLCSILGKNIKIDKDDSCGMYTPGGPAKESEMDHVTASFTPKEVGLVRDTKVRCENCRWGGASKCANPVLNINISPTGCCCAWTVKGK